MDFNQLIKFLTDTHDIFQTRAFQTVNINLTLRNWFFGMYIVEYEQNGQDRANYGDAVISEIAEKFKVSAIKWLYFNNLNLYRQFYLIYPQIIQTASEQFDFKQLKQSLPVKLETLNQMEEVLSKGLKVKIKTVSEEFVPVDNRK